MTLTPTTRASLLLRLRDPGDHDAWVEFVSLYEPVIYRVLRRTGLQDADTLEVLPELFLAVNRNIGRWEHGAEHGSFRGWLHRVTRNLVASWVRRQRRRVTTSSVDLDALLESPPAADGPEPDEFDRELRRALFHLASERVRAEVRPQTWQAFWKVAVSGSSVAEAAAKLEMTAGAVRVAKCRNHLKQIGLALENYRATNDIYPPASIRLPAFLNNGRDEPRSTWTTSILPYLDAAPLYRSYLPTVSSDDPVNNKLRAASIPGFLCPTDTGAEIPFEPRLGITYRRGNYGANFGTASWGTDDWLQIKYRDVMGQNIAVRHADITDGSSQTVLVAELRIQPSPRDNRGVWAFPGAGSASVGLDCDSLCRRINSESTSD